jgi:NTP pyrophosphatase (non-canonical NTP hydrolase)
MNFNDIVIGADVLAINCHHAAVEAGWWTDLATGERFTREQIEGMVPTKLLLIVSEITEGMEGHRKGLQDDHLPHRPSLEVELADAVIRAFDLAGALGFDLPGAISDKMRYNSIRADHKPANRAAPGGKAY